MSNSRRRQVEAAVKAIKDFYALGRALPAKVAHKDAYYQGVIDAEAATRGVNPDTLRKARMFANAADGYTRGELQALCRLVIASQPTQAADLPVFGRTHVMRLLGVPRARRATLQRAAVEKGWSVRELEAAIAARFGPRTAGGRKPKRPADVLDCLVHLERTCERWRRWVAEAGKKTEGDPTEPVLAELTGKVRVRVQAATAALAGLHAAVAAELAERQPRRVIRFVDRPPA